MSGSNVADAPQEMVERGGGGGGDSTTAASSRPPPHPLVSDDDSTHRTHPRHHYHTEEIILTIDTNTGKPEGEKETVAVDEEGDIYSPTEVEIEGKASIGGTVLNMMCNVIGGGVLSLPTGFNNSSLVLGLILLAFTASVTIANLVFIVECADATKIYTYRLLLVRGLGEKGARVVDFALFVFPFGALVLYARVIADAMPPVMKNFFHAEGFWLGEATWFFIGFAAFFSLSCRKSLAELKLSSIFGLATIFYAVLLVIIRFLDGSYSRTKEPATVDEGLELLYFKLGVFKTIPILTFSLSVHNNAPAYYEELQNRTPKKMYKVLAWAHGGIISTYALIGLFGLMTFGPRIQHAKGDILDAYKDDDQLMNSARLFMFIHFACVYPILHMAARRGLNNFIFKHSNLSMKWIVVETYLIVAASCILAALIPSIDTVISINGAAFGSIIILIAPSILFLNIDPFGPNRPNLAHELLPPAPWKRTVGRAVAKFSIVFGTIVGVIGVVVTLADEF